MKKRILAALVASAAVLSLAGCNTNNESGNSGAGNSGGNSNNESSGTTPAAGGEKVLTILTWGGNSDTTTMVDFFCEKTGHTKDEVVIKEIGSGGEAARDGYPDFLKTDEDADLVIMDCDWTTAYINGQYGDILAEYSSIGLNRSDFTDSYAYTLSYGTSEDGKFMANSFQATPGGFVYRADLAEQYLGVKTPEEMQAKVKDWATFSATAKELAEASGGKVKLQSTEGGLWQVYQSNRTKPWVVDGKLVMDNAEDFYDICKNLVADGGLDSTITQWSASWYASVHNGDALGDFAPTWGLTTNPGSILYNFSNETKEQQAVDENGNPKVDENGKPVMEIVAVNGSESGDIMRICAGPSGWFWGGSYIGVTKKNNSADLSKEFIEFFCKNADTMQAYAEKTNDFVNNKTVMSSLKANNTLLGGQDHYAVLNEVLNKLDLEGKVTKYDSVIKGLFNESVGNYLNGTFTSKEDAVVQFKQDVVAKLPNDVKVEE